MPATEGYMWCITLWRGCSNFSSSWKMVKIAVASRTPTKAESRCMQYAESKYAQIPQISVWETTRQKKGNIFYLAHIEELPVNTKDIMRATCKILYSARCEATPQMERARRSTEALLHTQTGPEKCCILCGQWVIIPLVYRQRLLEDFHHGHPIICCMKALAHSYPWSPGCDGETQELVQGCPVCQAALKMPAVVPLHQMARKSAANNWHLFCWERQAVLYNCHR